MCEESYNLLLSSIDMPLLLIMRHGKSEARLARNENTRRIMAIRQICQSLLPIKVFYCTVIRC